MVRASGAVSGTMAESSRVESSAEIVPPSVRPHSPPFGSDEASCGPTIIHAHRAPRSNTASAHIVGRRLTLKRTRATHLRAASFQWGRLRLIAVRLQVAAARSPAIAVLSPSLSCAPVTLAANSASSSSGVVATIRTRIKRGSGSAPCRVPRRQSAPSSHRKRSWFPAAALLALTNGGPSTSEPEQSPARATGAFARA